MKFLVPRLLIFLVIIGCSNKKNPDPVREGYKPSANISAEGFSISESNGNFVLTVHDPWQKAENKTFTYRLVRDSLYKDGYKDKEVTVRIPAEKVVCLSTTHVGFIERLGRVTSIAGVSGKDLVVSKDLRALIDKGSVYDVGYDENLNFELILDLKPDVVFAYGINASVNKMVARLREFGIPVVLVAEYLEEDPLAKMEWIKFFGCFFNTLDDAAAIFDSAANEYNRLRELTIDLVERPTVLTGLPWQGTWYVSGGLSYIARLISDAGGLYLWDSLKFRDSRPIRREKVYEKALTTEFSINTGSANSVSDIINVDSRFGSLNVFNTGHIFNNNKLLNASGGNGYFEYGVVEPHIILAALISILHPQLLPSHMPNYYHQLP